MRFTVQLPTQQVEPPGEFCTAAAIAGMARAAEAAGFDACFVTDHPIPGDRWLAAGGHHALDPFVALSCAAAATQRIRLQTHVLVAAYRNPFLLAKSLASLDVASGGRSIAGLAAGYLEPEFAALGARFERRNELADEAIAVLKQVFRGESVALRGIDFAAQGNTALPRPAQRPHPPIWCGGNSRRAIRRAVELADGWLPFPVQRGLARRLGTAPLASEDDLARALDYAREHAARTGRSAPLDVVFTPFGMDMQTAAAGAMPESGALLETIERLSALGVTWIAASLPCESRAEFEARAAHFGERVIAQVSQRA